MTVKKYVAKQKDLSALAIDFSAMMQSQLSGGKDKASLDLQQATINAIYDWIDQNDIDFLELLVIVGVCKTRPENLTKATPDLLKAVQDSVDQREPFSQVAHAWKTVLGGILLLTDLPQQQRDDYATTTKETWSTENVKKHFSTNAERQALLQACFFHDCAQMLINYIMEQHGFDMNLAKHKHLNDRHDELGGKLLARHGILPNMTAGYIIHHGEAKEVNAKAINGYASRLSTASQETRGARKLDAESIHLDVRLLLFRIMEDSTGKDLHSGPLVDVLIQVHSRINQSPLLKEAIGELPPLARDDIARATDYETALAFLEKTSFLVRCEPIQAHL